MLGDFSCEPRAQMDFYVVAIKNEDPRWPTRLLLPTTNLHLVVVEEMDFSLTITSFSS